METKPYVRKPFKVDGLQVKPDNLEEVAEWCGGEIIRSDERRPHIQVDVQNALRDRQKQAFVGDWVLKSPSGFKVYTDKAFKTTFEDDAPDRNEEDYSPQPVLWDKPEDAPADAQPITRNAFVQAFPNGYPIGDIHSNPPQFSGNTTAVLWESTVDPKDQITGKR